MYFWYLVFCFVLCGSGGGMSVWCLGGCLVGS